MQKLPSFSKLNKQAKINFIIERYMNGSSREYRRFSDFWHPDEKQQELFEQFSENILSNFHLPFGVVPNFLLNAKEYCVPMVTEESSVIAACAKSAKFWAQRGGFHARVLSSVKEGQIHFYWTGSVDKLRAFFSEEKKTLMNSVAEMNVNMAQRGGGLLDIFLIDCTKDDEHYFQLLCTFETCNAMGANFINSILEALARNFRELIYGKENLIKSDDSFEIIMAIVSNYNSGCLVESWVECPVENMIPDITGMTPINFVRRLQKAIRISKIDINRAVTHNKGIMNGVDAVVLATGNDFRAIEASVHAWASRDGKYKGLTDIEIEDDLFRFKIKLPVSVGTIGGLTTLHPMAKLSLDMLGLPDSGELMKVIAAVGLAQNFAALRSLVTHGIQRGHMKMHLMNILTHLEATDLEIEEAKSFFTDKVISFQDVRSFLSERRQYH